MNLTLLPVRWQRPLEQVVFGIFPVVLTGWLIEMVWAPGHGVDFRLQYWLAGWRVIHGLSPFGASHAFVDAAVAFPYPAFTALFFVPFGILPQGLGAYLFLVVCVAAPLLTLRLLNVADWRLYGFVLMLSPVVSGWQTGNLTLLLCLGLAVLWRYRDLPGPTGLVASVLISLKPFMWPVAIWLVATRRWKAGGYALLSGLVFNVISWSIVGFGQVSRFVHVTLTVTHVFRLWGYGIAAFLLRVGASQGWATSISVLVAAGLIVALVVSGGRGWERRALISTVALTISASPIVWLHYFALAIVPLAVVYPRLASTWSLLLPLWLCPITDPATWQSLLAFALVGSTLVIIWRRPVALAQPDRRLAAARRIMAAG